jgi:hypothetical protein
MKRFCLTVALFVLAVSSGCGRRPVTANAFQGSWRAAAVDRGLASVDIDRKNDQWTARVWGLCHPENCDWGERPLSLLGPLGSAGIDRGLAVWDMPFATKYVTFSLNGDDLVVELETIYKDRKGRPNAHSVWRFNRMRNGA